MATKKQSYEENIEQINGIIEKFDRGELSLEDSIKEYEKAMKLLKESEKLLSEGEGKVYKVLNENGELELMNK